MADTGGEIMTPREQVILFLFGALPLVVVLLCALDLALEQYDDYRARERVWREIEIRSCRERHPSNQVSVFDQDAP